MLDKIQPSDIIAFVLGALSLFATLRMFKLQPKYTLSRERHDKLIAPMFFALEPFLFKSKNNDAFKKALEIISDNKDIAGGKFLEVLYLCSEHNDQENFNKLCSLANREFDKSCTLLGLRKRGVVYRLNRRQYKTQLMFWLFLIGNLMLLLVSICTGLLIMSAVFSLLQNLTLAIPKT